MSMCDIGFWASDSGGFSSGTLSLSTLFPLSIQTWNFMIRRATIRDLDGQTWSEANRLTLHQVWFPPPVQSLLKSKAQGIHSLGQRRMSTMIGLRLDSGLCPRIASERFQSFPLHTVFFDRCTVYCTQCKCYFHSNMEHLWYHDIKGYSTSRYYCADCIERSKFATQLLLFPTNSIGCLNMECQLLLFEACQPQDSQKCRVSVSTLRSLWCPVCLYFCVSFEGYGFARSRHRWHPSTCPQDRY